MSEPKIDPLRGNLLRAKAFLDTALAAPESEIQRVAAVKGFEIVFELSWKLLQAELENEGIQVSTPRTTLRAAGDAGLIASVERWLSYLNARNLSVHVYNADVAAEIYAVIRDEFVADLASLLDRR